MVLHTLTIPQQRIPCPQQCSTLPFIALANAGNGFRIAQKMLAVAEVVGAVANAVGNCALAAQDLQSCAAECGALYRSGKRQTEYGNQCAERQTKYGDVFCKDNAGWQDGG